MNWFNISILIPMIVSFQMNGQRFDFVLQEDGFYRSSDPAYFVERMPDGMLMVTDSYTSTVLAGFSGSALAGTVNGWTFVGEDYGWDKGSRALALISVGYVFALFLDVFMFGLVWAFRNLRNEGQAAIEGAL